MATTRYICLISVVMLWSFCNLCFANNETTILTTSRSRSDATTSKPITSRAVPEAATVNIHTTSPTENDTTTRNLITTSFSRTDARNSSTDPDESKRITTVPAATSLAGQADTATNKLSETSSDRPVQNLTTTSHGRADRTTMTPNKPTTAAAESTSKVTSTTSQSSRNEIERMMSEINVMKLQMQLLADKLGIVE